TRSFASTGGACRTAKPSCSTTRGRRCSTGANEPRYGSRRKSKARPVAPVRGRRPNLVLETAAEFADSDLLASRQAKNATIDDLGSAATIGTFRGGERCADWRPQTEFPGAKPRKC